MLCELGATDNELAEFFEVSRYTIWYWQSNHKTFFDALRRGKEAANERVERALYSRATGYHYESEKLFYDKEAGVVRADTIEHVPPETTAAIFWLKNRDPKRWRDKVDVDANLNVIKAKPEHNMTDEELAAYYNELRARPASAQPLLIQYDKGDPLHSGAAE